MSLLPQFVKLDPGPHKYFDTNGHEYMSVSKILEHLHEEFDRETRSYQSARKILRQELKREPNETEIRVRQKALLIIWDDNNKKSVTIGSFVHDHIERLLKSQQNYLSKEIEQIQSRWGAVCINGPGLLTAAPHICSSELSGYQAIFPEECIYSKKYFIAGTSDFLGMRNAGAVPVIDISDYKTNASKGILYQNEYKKWLFPPVSHLEDCSYIKYALQLSFYAYMLEEHGLKPGRSKLIYIPPQDPTKYFPIPVPYMKLEVMAILDCLENSGVIRLRNQEEVVWA